MSKFLAQVPYCWAHCLKKGISGNSCLSSFYRRDNKYQQSYTAGGFLINFLLLWSESFLISIHHTKKKKYCELGKEERGANTKPMKGKFTTKVLCRACSCYNNGAQGQKLRIEGDAGKNLTSTL